MNLRFSLEVLHMEKTDLKNHWQRWAGVSPDTSSRPRVISDVRLMYLLETMGKQVLGGEST